MVLILLQQMILMTFHHQYLHYLLDSRIKNDFLSLPIKFDKIEIIIFCCRSEVTLSIKIVLGVFPVVELECTVLIISSSCTDDNFNFLNILDGIKGISCPE